MRRPAAFFIALLLVLATSSDAVPLLAAPSISDISLRGLEIGGTTVITIRGTELMPDPQLVLPLPVVRQTVRPGATAEAVEFEVEIDGQADAGIVPLRIASGLGISNALPIGADRLAQRPFMEKQTEPLPVALHGSVSGGEIKTATFQGRRGMRIVAEIESRRIGAELRPVLRILDSQGRQLEWAQGTADLLGDARCVVTLPADGPYQVTLHDAVYNAPQPSFFRLKIGELDYAETAFPLGVQRGQSASVRLLGHGKPADRVEVSVPEEYVDHWLPVRPRSPWFTGSAPRVAVSEHAEMMESRSGSEVQELPPAPIAVSGRLSKAGEEDRYLLNVQPGARLRFELFSQRVGAELDGVLIVRAEAGNELARGDDQPGTSDPGLDFTVPAETTKIQLAVQDLLQRGGDLFVYRLLVRDLGQPSLGLVLESDRLTLARGGRQTLRVTAVRANHAAPVELDVANLPAGVSLSGQRIPTGATMALLTLSADATASGYAQAQVRGQGAVGETPLQAVARTAESPVNRLQPWYRDHLHLAAGAPAPVTLDWQAPAGPLPRGGKLAVQLRLERGDGVTGKVRIRLLTTQPMPRKKVNENNQEKEVDDVERALRLEGDLVVEPQVAETVAQVLVPTDLPDVEWGLVCVAELLAADGSSVVATSSTECHYLRPVTPLAVELTSDKRITAKAGAGETGKFTGKLTRADGFAGPVNLTLAGLPEGYTAPQLTIAAEQQEFEFPIAFAEGAAAAELKNVQLIGTLDVSPENAIRSAAVPVEIVVEPGM